MPFYNDIIIYKEHSMPLYNRPNILSKHANKREKNAICNCYFNLCHFSCGKIYQKIIFPILHGGKHKRHFCNCCSYRNKTYIWYYWISLLTTNCYVRCIKTHLLLVILLPIRYFRNLQISFKNPMAQNSKDIRIHDLKHRSICVYSQNSSMINHQSSDKHIFPHLTGWALVSYLMLHNCFMSLVNDEEMSR